MKLISILILTCAGFINGFAQDLSGKWVIADPSPDYYAELNLVKNLGSTYAGHSYDTEAYGYCHHYLEADFNKESLRFVGRDVELIDKTESHEATSYNLKYEKGEDGKDYLVGTQRINPLQQHRASFGFERLYQMNRVYTDTYIRYVKVSEQYEKVEDKYYASMTPEAIELEKSKYPEIPVNPDLDATIEEEKPIIILPEIKEEVPSIIQKMNDRTNKTLAQIQAKSLKMTLLIRDYGTVDNDSIAVFFDGKLVKENLRIERQAYEIQLELEPNTTHELVFVAENLGDIPPNTARITLISDDKRFHYKLFTDDEFNAKIVIQTDNINPELIQ